MRHLIKALFPLMLSLTGCAYHSRYQNAEIHLVNKWAVADRNIINSDERNLPCMAWWNGFHDPTLNQLIKMGIANNNTINMSRGSIEAAEGELKKVKLQWVPDIDFLLGYSNNPATGFPGFLALFAPSYTINIFSQIREQKKATYELAEVKAEDDAIKLTVISQIAASYFTYQAEVERRRLVQALAKDIRELSDLTTRIYKNGLSSGIDPQELYTQVNRVNGEIEVIESNIVVSANAIHYLINQAPGDIRTSKRFLDLNNNQLIPGSLPLTVLENRPDMQMAKNRLQASNQSIGLAASKLLPTIHLDLILGPVAGNNRYILPRQMVHFNDQLLKIPGLKLSVLGEIAKARGLEKVSFFNYLDTLQKALRDTTNALSANDRLTNKFKLTQTAQTHLAKIYNLNHRLYKRGIQNYMDILKSKIALDKINIDLNQDKLQQLITTVNLYQELAGGYKVEYPEEPLAEK